MDFARKAEFVKSFSSEITVKTSPKIGRPVVGLGRILVPAIFSHRLLVSLSASLLLCE